MTVEPIDEAGALYAAEVSREGRFLSDAVIAHIADIASEHGRNFEGEGDRSVQIGGQNLNNEPGRASDLGAVAVGAGATALSSTSLALGWSARAGAESGSAASQIAIGDAATATGAYSAAIGPGASSTADHTMALGPERATVGSPVYTVRVPGRLKLSNRNTEPDDAATIGMLNSVLDRAYPSRSEGDTYAVALGRLAKAGGSSVALGGAATSPLDRSVAVGRSANAAGTYSTAVGASASARADNSTALGGSSTAAGESAVAIGGGMAGGLGAVAVGSGAMAPGILSMSLGTLAPSAPANTAVIGPEMGLNDDMTPTGGPYVVRIPGALELSTHNTLPGHAARRDWVEQYVAENGGAGGAPDVEWDGPHLVVDGERSPDLTGPVGPAPSVSWSGPRLTVGGATGPDLTGPPGAPGTVPTAQDYMVVGPGRPDAPTTTGMSSAALAALPVGAEYRSTDGASVGAWVWRKRPTGWVVTDGDTGWVDWSASVGGRSGGHFKVRRTTSAVHAALDDLMFGSLNSGQPTVTLPAGFTVAGATYIGAVYAQEGGTVAGGNYARIDFLGGSTIRFSAATSTLRLRDILRLPPSTDPWPTTLPGTSV